MDTNDKAYKQTWIHDSHSLHKECGGLRRACGKKMSCLSEYCKTRYGHGSPESSELLGCSDKKCNVESCRILRETCKDATPELCCNIDKMLPLEPLEAITDKKKRNEYIQNAILLRYDLAPKLFLFLELHGNSKEMKRAVAKRFGIVKVQCEQCKEVIFRYDPRRKDKNLAILIILISLFLLALCITLLCCPDFLKEPGRF